MSPRFTLILYLLPFSYFARTRLLQGSAVFHISFEWGAAILLAGLFGVDGLNSVWTAGFVYLAFISIYEIGYLGNDLIATRFETEPRVRGPQEATWWWLVPWIGSRLATFAGVTVYLGWAAASPNWWLFFASLCIVFTLHNLFRDNSLKSVTFIWLAWFRFVAPVFFILVPSQRMGIIFGGGLLYAMFRLFGYLDSKGVLNLPKRKDIRFRAAFFTLPGSAVVATIGLPEAVGFQALVVYFVTVAMVALLVKRSTRMFR